MSDLFPDAKARLEKANATLAEIRGRVDRATNHYVDKLPSTAVKVETATDVLPVNPVDDEIGETIKDRNLANVRRAHYLDSVVDYGIARGIVKPASITKDDVLSTISEIKQKAVEAPNVFENDPGLTAFLIEHLRTEYGLKYKDYEELKVRLPHERQKLDAADKIKEIEQDRFIQSIKADGGQQVILDDGKTTNTIFRSNDPKLNDSMAINTPGATSVGLQVVMDPDWRLALQEPEADTPEAKKIIARYSALTKDATGPLQDTYIPINVDSKGVAGVSANGMRSVYSNYFYRQLLRDNKLLPSTISPAQHAELRAQAQELAQAKIARIQAKNRKTLFVDTDPTATTEAIATGTDAIANLMYGGPRLLAGLEKKVTGTDYVETVVNAQEKLGAPYRAMLYPVAFENENGITLGPKLAQSPESPFWWLLRTSAFNPVYAYMFNPDVESWGDDRHIAHIRSGQDTGSHTDYIAEQMPYGAGSFHPQLYALAVTGGMIITDPDFIGAATAGVADVARVGFKAVDTMVVNRKLALAGQAKAMVQSGADLHTVAAFLAKNDAQDLLSMFESELVMRTPLPMSAARQADALKAELPAFDSRLNQIIDQAKVANADGQAAVDTYNTARADASTALKQRWTAKAAIATAEANIVRFGNYLQRTKGIGPGGAASVKLAQGAITSLQRNIAKGTKLAKSIPALTAQAAAPGLTKEAAQKAQRQLAQANKALIKVNQEIAELSNQVGSAFITTSVQAALHEKTLAEQAYKAAVKDTKAAGRALFKGKRELNAAFDKIAELADIASATRAKADFIRTIPLTAVSAIDDIMLALEHMKAPKAPASQSVTDRAILLRQLRNSPERPPMQSLGMNPAKWAEMAGIQWQKIRQSFSGKYSALGGSYAPEVEAAARGAIEGFARAQYELAELVKRSDDPQKAVVEYLASTRRAELGYDSTLMNRTTTTSPFEKFLAHVRELPSELVPSDPALRAVASAFLPPGAVGDEMLGILVKTVQRFAKSPPLGSPEKLLEQLMNQLRGVTLSRYKVADINPRAAAFYANGIMYASVVSDLYTDLFKVIGPGLSDESVNAINFLIRNGEFMPGSQKSKQGLLDQIVAAKSALRVGNNTIPIAGTAGAGNDVLVELYEHLIKWGLDSSYKFSPTTIEGMRELLTLFRRVSSSPDKISAIPEGLRKSIERVMDDNIKELTQHSSRKSIPEQARELLWRFISFQKTTLVVGFLYPRLGGWVTDTAGTITSAFLETGTKTATKTATAGIMNTIPGIGPLLQQRIRNGKYVPTLMESLVDTDVAKLLTQVESETMRVGGKDYTYLELYTRLMKGGGLMSIVSEDILRLNQRAILAGASIYGFRPKSNLFARYRQAWLDHYEYSQRARNAAVFMDRLRATDNIDTAIKETLDISYDWRWTVSDWERRYISGLATFYTLLRAQMAQINNVFMEPLTKSFDKGFTGALTARNKTSRLRQSAMIQTHLPDWLDTESNYGEPATDGEQYDEALKRRMAWWHDTRLIYDVQEMPVSDREWFEARGKVATHYTRSMPSIGALEGLYLYGLFVQTMWGAAIDGAAWMTDSPGVTAKLNSHAQVVDALTKQMTPLLQGITESFTDNVLREEAYAPVMGRTTRVNEAEVLTLFEQIGLGNYLLTDDQGRKYAPALLVEAMRQLPVTNEIGQLIHGVDNPKLDEGYLEYIKYMFSHFTTIGKYNPATPKADIDSGKRSLDAEFEKTKERLDYGSRQSR